MVASQTDIKSQTIELSAKAFETFCKDASDMFELDMQCSRRPPGSETIDGLGKRFKKLASVNSVSAEGTLNGDFRIILDREGLFTLGGLFAKAPENEILNNRKRGTAKDAQNIIDAVGEAGNMIVDACNKVFAQKLDGHGQFAQTDTFIGNPWDNPEKKINIAPDEELLFIPFEMKIGSYSSFNCGLIFPTSFFTQTPPFNAKTETPADAEITTSQPEDTKLESEKGPEPVSETPDQTTEQEQTPPPQQKQPPTAGQEQISPDDADQPPRGKVSEAIHKMLRSSAPPDGKSPRTVKIENAGLTDIPASSQGSAKDIMQKNIVWASPDDSVQQTLTKMQQTDSGYVMVGKEGSLDGIVSTSDIAAATSIYLKPMFAKWRRPMDDATLQIKIKWVMNKPIHTVKPDTSLASIMDNMSRAEIRCLPVLDEQNKVLGLITACDIFKTLMNTPSNK